ncbi:MAG TPA: polyprenyl synthetase family protein [Candidatus Aminicenantes bacterium]|nr:polyprenyl synthetase family protein [Candidatus Aminicenantes bacterium]
MTFEAYFGRTAVRLRRDLGRFLASKRPAYEALGPWGRDVLRRLESFTRKGKLVRGGLVSLGYEMAGGRGPSAAAVRAGTAIELVQSGLLIHDDIMDRDERRRGAPSMHVQYARLAKDPGGPGAALFGANMAVCAGEIAIFLGFEAMAGLAGPAGRAAAAQRLFAAEFGLVGLGQMRDIEAGGSGRRPSERAVLETYRFKTARYSYALPLAMGWVLGGGRRGTLPALDRLGEGLGLIFQIKDDELGLFGSPRDTGKPVGSDIRQGKKTLYALRLLARASGPDRDRLERTLGRPDAPEADILYVRGLAERLGVREEVNRVMASLGRRAGAAVAALPVAARHREILQSLLRQGLSRRR